MKKSETHAPVVTIPPSIDLIDSDGSTLVIDDVREGERFSGIDLSGRALPGIRFSECALLDVSLNETDLRGSRFLESRITRLSAPVFRAPLSVWRDCIVEQSRIGSGELFQSSWQSVRLSHCKLGYLNLRDSELFDVEFSDCTIDELDLAGAKAVRVAFVNTTVQTLDVGRSTLQHFDLRGAGLSHIRGIESLKGITISELQLAELAPILAARLGITIGPSQFNSRNG